MSGSPDRATRVRAKRRISSFVRGNAVLAEISSVVGAMPFPWAEAQQLAKDSGEGFSVGVCGDYSPPQHTGSLWFAPWSLPRSGRVHFRPVGCIYVPPAGQMLPAAAIKAAQIADRYLVRFVMEFKHTALDIQPGATPEAIIETYCNLNQIDVQDGWATLAAYRESEEHKARKQEATRWMIAALNEGTTGNGRLRELYEHAVVAEFTGFVHVHHPRDSHSEPRHIGQIRFQPNQSPRFECVDNEPIGETMTAAIDFAREMDRALRVPFNDTEVIVTPAMAVNQAIQLYLDLRGVTDMLDAPSRQGGQPARQRIPPDEVLRFPSESEQRMITDMAILAAHGMGARPQISPATAAPPKLPRPVERERDRSILLDDFEDFPSD